MIERAKIDIRVQTYLKLCILISHCLKFNQYSESLLPSHRNAGILKMQHLNSVGLSAKKQTA